MGRAIVVSVLALTAACATSRPPSGSFGGGAQCAWQVCVYASAAGEYLTFRARNSGPVDATVSLTFGFLQNLRTDEDLPVVRVVRAGETELLIRLERADREATFDASPVASIDLGTDDATPDLKFRYSLPFGGEESRLLVSGYGGPTHVAENYYGLDFAMPAGTPVLAARRGVVVEVRDGETEGGLDPEFLGRANLVVVAHPDGALSSYGHLSPGIVVAVGDSVVERQLIGYSGATGFAGVPHLHFQVGKRLVHGEDRTLPVLFEAPDGDALQAEEGRRYGPSMVSGERDRGVATSARTPSPLRRGALTRGTPCHL